MKVHGPQGLRLLVENALSDTQSFRGQRGKQILDFFLSGGGGHGRSGVGILHKVYVLFKGHLL